MIRLVALSGVLFCAAAAVCAEKPATSAPASAERALDVRIDEIKCDHLPLEKFLNQLAAKVGSNEAADWQALKGAGIDAAKEITIIARGVTIDEALSLIAEQTGGTEGFGTLASGANIVITTRSGANKVNEVRTYDVADLIKMTVAEFQGERRKVAEQIVGAALAGVLARAVESESWAEVNHALWPSAGAEAFGELSYAKGKVTARTTLRVHKMLAAFLAELRREDSATSPAATASAATARADAAAVVLGFRFAAFNWENAPLEKVFADVAAKLPVNLVMDWHAIKKDEGENLTLKVRGVTLDELLCLLTRQRNRDVPLDFYTVGANVVVTTEQEVRKRHTEIRTYAVGDLVKANLAGLSDEDEKTPRQQAEFRFMQAVLDNVDSDRWIMVGDVPWPGAGNEPYGTMDCYEGKLIVTTTPRVHAKLAAFLADMRKNN